MEKGAKPMKFHYDEKEDCGECVAYIDDEGGLNIKTELCNDASITHICFDEDGFTHTNLIWCPSGAIKRFYPGDKITIEF
jgi:hypothetical protein